MPLSRSRDYLSIGEVLDALRGDFPDITISKIRFLENEGLLDPERTPSGYRKFYETDVARLRYILSLQRDHFLPLKVIRERLSHAQSEDIDPAGDIETSVAPEAGAPPVAPIALSRDELKQSAGLADDELGGLCEYGLLASEGPYDGFDLAAAKAARGLFKFGVEPRHLRMYRQFADRETAFFEQIVSPVARRKDPEAQREAERSIVELVALSRRFRDAVLSANLRGLA